MAEPVRHGDSATLAAKFLAGHFRDGTAGMPTIPGPSTRSESYRIQDCLVAELGEIVAWKVGRGKSSPEPYCAPVLRQRLYQNDGRYRRPIHLSAASVEAEIGLVIGKDVPAGNRTYSREDALALVDTVVLAIEILETRLAGAAAGEPFWKLADLQANGGVVFGPGTPRGNRTFRSARLSIDAPGVLGTSQEVRHPFGDPADLLQWMVNHAAHERGGLKRGQVVITGSYCGILALSGPGACRVEFDDVGCVKINLL